ncbi:hypothetical protein NDU88_003475 [Pleurodeles waltl]|uniref:Uncharacterized protein n=1 Tax=Pleurodeles waltl TaxID=8319 RepID=A0AAV7MRX8_PLEWA|nr:hypothetical protein NDU88_003475 [Pleurodeles waltl]
MEEGDIDFRSSLLSLFIIKASARYASVDERQLLLYDNRALGDGGPPGGDRAHAIPSCSAVHVTRPIAS